MLRCMPSLSLGFWWGARCDERGRWQAAKYGTLEAYAAWVGGTWAGFALPPKTK